MSRDFITTWTGKRFNPLKPDATKVDIRDIAHALSQLCRFGGHCTKFYSVAEHSILVSRMVPPEEELAALLHDAAEAYIGDMVTPLKKHMKQFCDAEKPVLETIFSALNVLMSEDYMIKEADHSAFLLEAHALLSNTEGIPESDVSEKIHCYSPKEAEENFLKRYYELVEGYKTRG